MNIPLVILGRQIRGLEDMAAKQIIIETCDHDNYHLCGNDHNTLQNTTTIKIMVVKMMMNKAVKANDVK